MCSAAVTLSRFGDYCSHFLVCGAALAKEDSRDGFVIQNALGVVEGEKRVLGLESES